MFVLIINVGTDIIRYNIICVLVICMQTTAIQSKKDHNARLMSKKKSESYFLKKKQTTTVMEKRCLVVRLKTHFHQIPVRTPRKKP